MPMKGTIIDFRYSPPKSVNNPILALTRHLISKSYRHFHFYVLHSHKSELTDPTFNLLLPWERMQHRISASR